MSIFQHWNEELPDEEQFKTITGREVSPEELDKEIEKGLENYSSFLERSRLLDLQAKRQQQ